MERFIFAILLSLVLFLLGRYIRQRIIKSRMRRLYLKDLSSQERPNIVQREKPTLKQFSDLSSNDFNENPVWVQCHTADYGQKWYDETDEESFRPWDGELPISPDEAIFLIKSNFTLNNGDKYSGFMTPVVEADCRHENDLGYIQPHIITEDTEIIHFWTGMFPIDKEKKSDIYNSLNCTPDEIFPISFSASDTLAKGIITGKINGFLARKGDDKVIISK